MIIIYNYDDLCGISKFVAWHLPYEINVHSLGMPRTILNNIQVYLRSNIQKSPSAFDLFKRKDEIVPTWYYDNFSENDDTDALEFVDYFTVDQDNQDIIVHCTDNIVILLLCIKYVKIYNIQDIYRCNKLYFISELLYHLSNKKVSTSELKIIGDIYMHFKKNTLPTVHTLKNINSYNRVSKVVPPIFTYSDTMEIIAKVKESDKIFKILVFTEMPANMIDDILTQEDKLFLSTMNASDLNDDIESFEYWLSIIELIEKYKIKFSPPKIVLQRIISEVIRKKKLSDYLQFYLKFFIDRNIMIQPYVYKCNISNHYILVKDLHKVNDNYTPIYEIIDPTVVNYFQKN